MKYRLGCYSIAGDFRGAVPGLDFVTVAEGEEIAQRYAASHGGHWEYAVITFEQGMAKRHSKLYRNISA